MPDDTAITQRLDGFLDRQAQVVCDWLRAQSSIKLSNTLANSNYEWPGTLIFAYQH